MFQLLALCGTGADGSEEIARSCISMLQDVHRVYSVHCTLCSLTRIVFLSHIAVPTLPSVFNVPGLHLVHDEQALLSGRISVRLMFVSESFLSHSVGAGHARVFD